MKYAKQAKNKVLPSLSISDVDAAWASGFFDGEGCVALTRTAKGGFSVVATVTQKHLPPLEKLKSLFGGAVHDKGGNRKGYCHSWATSAALAERFLRAILPYSIEKKEQIEVALLYRAMPWRGQSVKRYGFGEGKARTRHDAHKQVDETFFKTLQEMKRDAA
jgi:hypothetical protein